MKRAYGILKRSVLGFGKHRDATVAAALAFYTLFSMAPVALISVQVAGMVLGEEEVRAELLEQVRDVVGEEGAEEVSRVLSNERLRSLIGGNLSLTTAVTAVTLLFGATAFFRQLKDGMNAVWNVEPERNFLWSWGRKKLIALGMVLLVGFGLLTLVIAGAALEAGESWIASHWEVAATPLRWLNAVLTIGVAGALFGAMYKFLPDVRVSWRDVWIAGLGAGALFAIGRSAVSAYLGKSVVASAYGAAGSLIVILLWVYYSSLVFLFGAEVCRACASSRGERPERIEDDGA